MSWPFALFACITTALAVWAVLRQRALGQARVRALAELGFAPCDAQAPELGERVARLASCSRYAFLARAPQRASLEGCDVYWLVVERRRAGEGLAAQQLLFPLERRVPDGLVLFYKPSALGRGVTTKLIARIATGAWDARPDDLVPLDIPIDEQQGNLIAALAPAGASLYDLIDAKALALLEPVADLGAGVVSCRGSDCSFTGTVPREPLDVAALWPLVRQLTTH